MTGDCPWTVAPDDEEDPWSIALELRATVRVTRAELGIDAAQVARGIEAGLSAPARLVAVEDLNLVSAKASANVQRLQLRLRFVIGVFAGATLMASIVVLLDRLLVYG